MLRLETIKPRMRLVLQIAVFFCLTQGEIKTLKENPTGFICRGRDNKTRDTSLCYILQHDLKAECVKITSAVSNLSSFPDLDTAYETVARCGVLISSVNNKTSSKPRFTEAEQCVTLNLVYKGSEEAAYSCHYLYPEKCSNNSTDPTVLEVFGPLLDYTIKGFVRKKHFVVTTLPYGFDQIKITNQNGSVYTGITFDLLDVLAEYLNFDYEILEPVDGHWGATDDNGQWTGMIGQIINGEVDFGAASFTITKERLEAVDFLTYYQEQSGTFIIKSPAMNTMTLYLKPFHEQTWLFIVATVISVILVTKLLSCNVTNDESRVQSGYFTKYPVLYAFAYIVNQGRPESPVQPSSRVLMSCYWIFTITIIAAYSANLIAVLTVQKHRLPIDSLEELAAHPEYQAGVNDGAVLSELFKKSNATVYRDVWTNNINVNPNNLMSESDDFLSIIHRVRKEQFVMIFYLDSLRYLLKKHEICDVAVSKDRFFKSNFAFTTPKNFPYADMFNRRIGYIRSTGLLMKWQRKYWRKENACGASLSNVGHFKTNLRAILGAYIILAIGLAMATLTFFLEFCFKSLQQFYYSKLNKLIPRKLNFGYG